MSELTKIGIMDTLIELLYKKPFRKITVKDLVTECGINRNTFYYHFEDIYDLLHQTFLYEVKKANIESINLDNYQEKVDELLPKLLQYRNVVLHIFNSVETRDLVRNLREVYHSTLEKSLIPLFEELSLDQKDASFFLKSLCNALIGFTLEWIDTKLDETFFREHLDEFTHWLNMILALRSI